MIEAEQVDQPESLGMARCPESEDPPGQRRCVLIDRDGTINVERCYLSSPDQLELLPAAAEGLRSLKQLGFQLAVVTNQSGLARGYFDAARLDSIHGRLLEMLHAEGVQLDGIFHCPHHPDDHCSCRKPNTGLAHQAARQLGFNLRGLFVIGDKPCDIEFGASLGATTLLVRTGYGAELEMAAVVRPDYIVDDLGHAAEIIQRLTDSTDSCGTRCRRSTLSRTDLRQVG